MNGMGGVRGTYGGQEKCVHEFWCGTSEEKRDNSENLSVERTIILKSIFKKYD
jgi:hypothetical protein